jgi:hypothetical protein
MAGVTGLPNYRTVRSDAKSSTIGARDRHYNLTYRSPSAIPRRRHICISVPLATSIVVVLNVVRRDRVSSVSSF